MADTYANQPIARLAAALEQALVKGALKGDKTLLDQLRREIVAVQQDATRPPPSPVVFTGKKQLVFEALLAGCTHTEAAQRSGMSRSHTSRVATEPAMLEALAAAQGDRLRAANDALRALVPLSIQRLSGILSDPGAQHSVVIAALREVLDRAGVAPAKRLELTGAQGGPLQVATLTPESLAAMTPAQLAALTGVQYAPTGGEDDGSSPDEE
jgi:hypothetical protein